VRGEAGGGGAVSPSRFSSMSCVAQHCVVQQTTRVDRWPLSGKGVGGEGRGRWLTQAGSRRGRRARECVLLHALQGMP
jgi:hypothetical protein